jgi:predicted  nucleic acid-binding Zn-ribbon protein
MAEDIGKVAEGLRQTENRVNSLHSSIGTLRGDLVKTSTKISVLSKSQENLETDIDELKTEFGEKLSKLGKNIWVVSTTLASLGIALVGVLKA